MPIILIIVGILLIVFNYIAIKKESTSFEIRDQEKAGNNNDSFDKIFSKSKDELNDYKIELGIFRRNVAESLTELQEEILEIKKYLNIVKNEECLYEDNIEVENIAMDNIDDDIVSEINFKNKSLSSKSTNTNNLSDSKKTESIKELLQQGLNENEICHRLSISKGEVLLVKDLFRK